MLLNYVVNVLRLALFEAMVVEVAISIGAILATYVNVTFIINGYAPRIINVAVES